MSDWTGIPVGRMVRNEIEAILNLATVLAQRVIGQDHALEMIAKRIQTARAGLENPNKPIGVFLLVGPSGVGKTETALTIAEALYGGEQNVITINMSEFQEAHTVSTLKGAPPGYVGYGEGGVLTEAVRRRPYSVVLLDEVEKAHPDVHELFFQVFDKGWMEDGQGTRVDFKNTVILLTSNVGSDILMRLGGGSPSVSDFDLSAALRPPLLEVFPAALLGRMVVIPYYPLSDSMLGRIVRLQLDRVAAAGHPELRDPVRVRPARRGPDHQPLHRGGERRAHDRRGAHQHVAAADEPRIPPEKARWNCDHGREHDGERRRRVRVHHHLAMTAKKRAVARSLSPVWVTGSSNQEAVCQERPCPPVPSR